MFKFAGDIQDFHKQSNDHIGIGLGEDFKAIQSFYIKQKKDFLSLVSLSDLIESTKQTIASLKENASSDEEAVSEIAISNAVTFIEQIARDNTISIPDVLTDGDSGVAFEWRAEGRNTLVITFTPENEIVYACISENGELHGSEIIKDKKIPEVLLHPIRHISLLQV